MAATDPPRIAALRADFDALRASFTQKIASTIPATDPRSEQRKLIANQVLRELDEADELISQYETELAGLSAAQRSRLAAFARSSRDEVRRARKDLEKARNSSERILLLSPSGPSAPTAAPRDTASGAVDLDLAFRDQRTRLLAGTERLQDSSRRLDDIHRIALETETIGVSTLTELSTQRDQILRTRDTLERADSWITRSQNVLIGMQR
ncbi:hypothetical protein HK405_003497, partial [Cladochytrium tenue]